MKEVATDALSMLALDTLNRLSFSPDMPAYMGMSSGLALWQVWGKEYLKKNLQKLSLSSIITDPGKAEGAVEYDAELLLGLKGGIYTLSVYLSSLVMKGRIDRMNLVDAVLIGYGGSLSGAVVRSLN
jgi:hypothetical protein